MPNTAYVAETDENNRVCALWVKPKGQKSSRLFDPATEDFEASDPVVVSGATEADIKRWIAVQKTISAR